MTIDHIVTAKDYAAYAGGAGMRDWIAHLQKYIHRDRGVAVQIINRVSGNPVQARIWQGQWVADCDVCNGAMFVDPDEPVFFCFGCANRENGGSLRPVIFPDDRAEIERLILERPVSDAAGLTELERVGLSRPIISVEFGEGSEPVELSRNWSPGETVDDLKKQNAPVRVWKAHVEGGGDRALKCRIVVQPNGKAKRKEIE